MARMHRKSKDDGRQTPSGKCYLVRGLFLTLVM